MDNSNLSSIEALGPATKNQWTTYIYMGFLLYLTVCYILRFRRRDAMHKKHHFPTRESLSRMTNADSQEIQAYLFEYEFPKIFMASLQFALFKTYGIPTISSLLVDTKQLCSAETANKRYADTVVMIQEFCTFHPKAERTIRAIARMNYLHSRYQKSGKIQQDDLLYTLSVFITEPVAWIERYEWRGLTDTEICGISTFWKSIGDSMGIEYVGRLSKTCWKDGLEFYEDIKAWAEAYEITNMVPAKSNKQTADKLVPMLLFYVPDIFMESARNIVGVLLGERLRTAMMIPTPPRIYHPVADAILKTRRFIIRHLCLPRPDLLRSREISNNADPQTGRSHATNYLVHPYYVKPGLFNRWGPEAWLVWFSGGELPGSKRGDYVPEGYLIEDLGPEKMKGKGTEEMKKEVEKIGNERPVGCPFG